MSINHLDEILTHEHRNYNELRDAYDEQINRIADLECRLAELEEQLKNTRH
ncbi:MAG: hypothetical protein J6Z25_01415 [Opitutales bacterium]|nr:hypothetical protein [Opitutales bacterium]